MRYLFPAFFIAFILACAPSSEVPVDVMVLVPNAKNEFEPRQKQLKTISDISKLEGSVTSFIGGARMIVDENSETKETVEEYRKAVFKDKGGSVRAQFIGKDGVLWPADFHSWAMTTAYWNLEQAFLYFQEVYNGKNTKELLNIPTYYWLDTNISDPDKKESSTDNAFFFSTLRMMAVLPFKDLQTIPMSINLGVMAHEYAHFVFNTRVHHSDPFLPIYRRIEYNDIALNILASLEEGLADFHAVGIIQRLGNTENTRFFEWTLSKEAADERDLALPHCATNIAPGYNMRTVLENTKHEDFGKSKAPYYVGTLFAASFYQAASEMAALDAMPKFILNAYDGIRWHYLNTPPHEISLESVSDVFLEYITDTPLRTRVCSHMLNRLLLDKALMPHCPQQSLPEPNRCSKP